MLSHAQNTVMPSHSGTADEIWYWQKWVLCSGRLSIHGDVVFDSLCAPAYQLFQEADL